MYVGARAHCDIPVGHDIGVKEILKGDLWAQHRESRTTVFNEKDTLIVFIYEHPAEIQTEKHEL